MVVHWLSTRIILDMLKRFLRTWRGNEVPLGVLIALAVMLAIVVVTSVLLGTR